MSYNVDMRVSSVSFGTGAIHVPKSSSDICLSEFAFLPKQNQNKASITASELKKLVVGMAVVAVVVTLSRLKMPFKNQQMDFLNILC